MKNINFAIGQLNTAANDDNNISTIQRMNMCDRNLLTNPREREKKIKVVCLRSKLAGLVLLSL